MWPYPAAYSQGPVLSLLPPLVPRAEDRPSIPCSLSLFSDCFSGGKKRRGGRENVLLLLMLRHSQTFLRENRTSLVELASGVSRQVESSEESAGLSLWMQCQCLSCLLGNDLSSFSIHTYSVTLGGDLAHFNSASHSVCACACVCVRVCVRTRASNCISSLCGNYCKTARKSRLMPLL